MRISKRENRSIGSSTKLREAIYKSQQRLNQKLQDNGKDNKDKKDEDVVDADFEEVKEENKDGNQEKSA